MSWEGYYQLVCNSGHYWTSCAYGFEDPSDNACPVCGETPVWWNIVDETNGFCECESCVNGNTTNAFSRECVDCEYRIDGYVLLEKENDRICEHCNTVLETTYQVPQESGHKIEKQTLPTDGLRTIINHNYGRQELYNDMRGYYE